MTWRDADRGEAKPIRASIDQVARRLGVPTGDQHQQVFSGWEAAVGAEVARQAQPVSLVRGVLTLEVSDQRWLTQLRWLEASIVRKVNDAAGVSLVERIEAHLRKGR